MARKYTIRRESTFGEAETRIDYKNELNEQQFAAVTAPPGPALVIAGAGSGKTRTLTYRVAYLLENGIAPDRILLLTFTNKAAREMLERVTNLLPVTIQELWGGTFHSIGNRILRRHAEALGYEKNFSILDSEDQKDMMKSVLDDSKNLIGDLRFPKPKVLIDMFSYAVNTDQSLREVLAEKYDYFSHLEKPVAELRKKYVEKKKATNSMDFDDLLVNTLRLLQENSDLCELYQKKFQFILVDEYQDTNQIQSDLLDLLAEKHHNITVVGDDAQSVYSWRGANFRNIIEFPNRYPDASVFKIETNYRSVPEVLRLANAAIEPNRRQYKKALRPARPECDTLPALVALEDASVQAQFVAQRVLELRDEEGIELEEMAVLYRAHYQSMEIQMEFTRRGIPFTITSGLRFFEQAHVKDVAAFLKFAVNTRDEVSFKRMIGLLPGIGGISAQKLWLGWLGSEPGLKGAVPESFSQELLKLKVPKKASKGWEQLAYTLDELIPSGTASPLGPAEMIKSVIEGVYNDYMIGKFKNYESRRQDLDQLSEFGKQFDSTEEFLNQLALLAGVDGGPTSGGNRKGSQDEEMICLSSVHQGKGLEWKVVFVVGLCEGLFPNARVLDEDDDRNEGLEEERRLFYVAVTRAKDELYLTYPLVTHSYQSGSMMQGMSRFLEDLPDGLVEEWETGASW